MFSLTANPQQIYLKFDQHQIIWGELNNQLSDPHLDSTNAIFLAQEGSSSSQWQKKHNIITSSGQFSLLNTEVEASSLFGNSLLFKLKVDQLDICLIPSSNLKQDPNKTIEGDVLVFQDAAVNHWDEFLSISQNSNAKLIFLVVEKANLARVQQSLTENLTLIENGFRIKAKDTLTEQPRYFVLPV